MDESDFSVFGKKSSKSKHDKADATCTTANSPYGNESLNANVKEPIKKVIISRPTEDDEYNCDNPYAGIALIFNHKEVKGQKQRAGTEKDRDAMAATLLKYGFDVRVYDELTFAEVSEKLKATAQEDHSQNDCLVVVVMSHGLEGKVYARDMSYPVERLWNPFLGENCKSLINKPKLFFIQACRGENLEKAVTYTEFAPMSRALNTEALPPKPPTITYAIPNTADMLVMYSTFEKYYSFRNVENGSWFIQSLCAVFEEAATKEALYSPKGAEFLRLLTAVNRKVAYEYQSNAKYEALNQMKEMPNFLSTLTKTFYLRVKRPKDQAN
ncbi:death executioner caspase related to Apopain/Yama [Haematobia irritans]|uniref:death executioner caspase related to Apopain/Yama n=1 Tax=Haematobia irritans TaxID=7368 RepID=UPI003F4FE0F4